MALDHHHCEGLMRIIKEYCKTHPYFLNIYGLKAEDLNKLPSEEIKKIYDDLTSEINQERIENIHYILKYEKNHPGFLLENNLKPEDLDNLSNLKIQELCKKISIKKQEKALQRRNKAKKLFEKILAFLKGPKRKNSGEIPSR